VIVIEAVQNSGRHDHDGTRPVGEIVSGAGCSGNGTSKITCSGTTDGAGKYQYVYRASRFGGKEKFRLTFQNMPVVEKELVVRIPGLVKLPAGPNYELVGAPQNHAGTNDPCRGAPPSSKHNKNHYGTPQMITDIQEIARRFSIEYSGLKLRINDISLEYGGLFDVGNNWNPPHSGHRLGNNTDIGYSGIDENGQCVQFDQDVKNNLFQIIRDKLNKEPYLESDHFHTRYP
jgi:hypothetical protein